MWIPIISANISSYSLCPTSPDHGNFGIQIALIHVLWNGIAMILTWLRCKCFERFPAVSMCLLPEVATAYPEELGKCAPTASLECCVNDRCKPTCYWTCAVSSTL
ncbi:hypothetical protein RB195_020704 [Necator americanus]|uniref:WAP domain-containing protein n=1 Tax=Necator americanus TaxID=51031 RepID=A0ABR1CLB7_NECAM